MNGQREDRGPGMGPPAGGAPGAPGPGGGPPTTAGAAPDAWDPRYRAYARAHGRTPEAQRAHDRATRSDETMPFLEWIRPVYGQFCAAQPAHAARPPFHLWMDDPEWIAWLDTVGAP